MDASTVCKNLDERVARIRLDDGNGELVMLRDVVLRAHMATMGHNLQGDAEMIQRAHAYLEAALGKSPGRSGFLGRGGPEAHRDIIGGEPIDGHPLADAARHCPAPLAAAEGDLLGEALAALRKFDPFRIGSGPSLDHSALFDAQSNMRAVLAKAARKEGGA